MPTVPVSRLSKAKLVELYQGRCKHRHRYIDHYNCYLTERKDGAERIGFFDIEASNLKADFGIVLCYCIKDSKTGKIFERAITPKEMDTCLDKEVIKQLIKDFQMFDVIVTYYGTNFDMPFVRTRALNLGLDFPEFGDLKHKDVYFMVKSKTCMSSKRLENACRVLLGKTNKTRIDSNHWLKALRGNIHSINYIVKHCRFDVTDLESLYNKMCKYVANVKKNI